MAEIDVERLARALAMVNFGYDDVGTATRIMAELVAAEYERLGGGPSAVQGQYPQPSAESIDSDPRSE